MLIACEIIQQQTCRNLNMDIDGCSDTTRFNLSAPRSLTHICHLVKPSVGDGRNVALKTGRVDVGVT